MKRFINSLLVLIMIISIVGLYTACSQKVAPAPTTPAATTPAPTTPATTTPAKPVPTMPVPSVVAPTTTKPTQVPIQYDWPSDIVIGVCDVGGSDYTIVSAFAPVLEKLTGMRVRVVPEGSEPRKVQRMIEGEFDLQATGTGDLNMYHTGQVSAVTFPKADVRLVRLLFETPYAFYVKADSPIKTVYDIKKLGKQVRLSTARINPGIVAASPNAILAFLGMKEDDVTVVNSGSWSLHVSSVIDGRADVSFMSVAAAQAYEVEGYAGGIRILDLPLEDTAGWTRAVEAGGYIPIKVPYGIKSAIGKIGFAGPKILNAMVSTNEEFVYQLSKWFNENYDAYKDTHVSCTRMTMEAFRSYLDLNPFPLHEGSIRYLKELGQWTAKDDAKNKAAIQLLDKYVEAWNAANAEARVNGIKVSMDDDWVNIWKKHTAGFPQFLLKAQ